MASRLGRRGSRASWGERPGPGVSLGLGSTLAFELLNVLAEEFGQGLNPLKELEKSAQG
jgi:hypothetical protein